MPGSTTRHQWCQTGGDYVVCAAVGHSPNMDAACTSAIGSSLVSTSRKPASTVLLPNPGELSFVKEPLPHIEEAVVVEF